VARTENYCPTGLREDEVSKRNEKGVEYDNEQRDDSESGETGRNEPSVMI
jgi:hypothetical protein